MYDASHWFLYDCTICHQMTQHWTRWRSMVSNEMHLNGVSTSMATAGATFAGPVLLHQRERVSTFWQSFKLCANNKITFEGNLFLNDSNTSHITTDTSIYTHIYTPHTPNRNYSFVIVLFYCESTHTHINMRRQAGSQYFFFPLSVCVAARKNRISS